MREIKFKGWDGKKMTREYTLYEMLSLQLPNNGLKHNWLQYTGLKDKNGKKIFEGDIAIFGSDPAEQIIFKDGAFRWGGDFDYILQICEEYNIEVIGNIYENPELLDK